MRILAQRVTEASVSVDGRQVAAIEQRMGVTLFERVGKAMALTPTGQDLLAPRTWDLGNATVNRLLWTPDGLTLVGWGDRSHLDEGTLDEQHD